MTDLIVEDNTGRADAQSYVSLADFIAYNSLLGRDMSPYADPATGNAALTQAWIFINTNWRYKSDPINNDQAGEFPRVNLSDGMGRIFNTVPKRVKDAQCELGFVALSEALYQNLDRGGMVTSESVGPISTTYAAGAPAQKQFTAAVNFLSVFAKDGKNPRRPLPFAGGLDRPNIFDIGMTDNHEYD